METTDNPNTPDIHGKTPMIKADKLGYQEIVKLLKSHKTSSTWMQFNFTWHEIEYTFIEMKKLLILQFCRK